jgi:hypothetical protein
MNHRRSRLFPIAVTAAAGAALFVPAPPATATVGPLFALEIFAPENEPRSAPLCRDTLRGRQPEPSAEFPAGTVAVAVLQGSLPRGVRSTNRCRFRVDTGARSILVYKTGATRIDNRPALRTGVRVVAERDTRTGVWLAERIVGRNTVRNEVERAFLATVDVTDAGATEWTTSEIGGADRQFRFDVTAAEVEAGTTTPASIEFDTVPPEPEPPEAPPAP